MPTVILLDVSLSMARPVPLVNGESTGDIKLLRRSLAASAITSLLDAISANAKLEFCSLVAFSSLWELIVPFTRDFDAIKAALIGIEDYDKTCIETALDGVRSIVMEEWGAGVPCQVILLTDDCPGIGPNSLKSRLNELEDNATFVLPYPFPCKLHIICLSTASELTESLPLFNKLIQINGGEGNVYIPETLTIKGVQQAVSKLTGAHYQSFHGNLKCGNLSAPVTLFPSPVNYEKTHDFEHVKGKITTEISICGFMEMNDVGSPSAFTRHLVLPICSSNEEESSATKEANQVDVSETGSDEETSTSSTDDGKKPNFCVLLHGSLKVESMVAICQVGENWYGMLYSWADTRKKSNLMLTVFEPGNSIPWIGNFKDLAPISMFSTPPYGEKNNISPFPVKRNIERRSYAQNCVVWIKQSGLQGDIQKVLRHARKLPEKTQHFYRELNRLRRAALSFGFFPLLEGMASILERECTLLPGSAHPDAALQLSHAASALRNSSSTDIKHTITALRTTFTNDS